MAGSYFMPKEKAEREEEIKIFRLCVNEKETADSNALFFNYREERSMKTEIIKQGTSFIILFSSDLRIKLIQEGSFLPSVPYPNNHFSFLKNK